jgi:hypothetical protein
MVGQILTTKQAVFDINKFYLTRCFFLLILLEKNRLKFRKFWIQVDLSFLNCFNVNLRPK